MCSMVGIQCAHRYIISINVNWFLKWATKYSKGARALGRPIPVQNPPSTCRPRTNSSRIFRSPCTFLPPTRTATTSSRAVSTVGAREFSRICSHIYCNFRPVVNWRVSTQGRWLVYPLSLMLILLPTVLRRVASQTKIPIWNQVIRIGIRMWGEWKDCRLIKFDYIMRVRLGIW